MDATWMSAGDLAAAVRARKVSSVELLEHFRRRVDQHNPKVNAVVVFDWERARAQAAAADAALARGKAVGPLHGVPMTVKECFDVEGLPTTAGAVPLKANAALRHADAVRKLVDAGAVIFGKTNTPLFAGDFQTYNEVYGTTNNPWDLTRGPGGSSGGSAAALASGMTPLELGSDIGGSIRNPAHFCGVYGHKPSFGVVPLRGHVPGPPNSLYLPDIAVAGPLARNADDLDLALSVLAGPGEWDAAAWRIDLPAPRRQAVADYRVALCPDDAFCPVETEIADAISRAGEALAKTGATVRHAKPAIDFANSFRLFYRMLAATLAPGYDEGLLQQLAIGAKAATDQHALSTIFMAGSTMRHVDYIRAEAARQEERARWADFFTGYDVFLCPIVMTAAFAHDHSPDLQARHLTVNGVRRGYLEAIGWAGLIGNVRLPATVVPVGRTRAGLPIGMQVVGPYLEDRTCIEVARHLFKLMGGFTPPPAFA
jgi:amidase